MLAQAHVAKIPRVLVLLHLPPKSLGFQVGMVMLGFGCFFLVVLFVFETFCYAAQASLEHVASLLFLLLSAETILHIQL